MYGINYTVIRNVATYKPLHPIPAKEAFILYQGAVNEGRCFETLLPAMADIELPLFIYGEGNFLQQAKKLVDEFKLHDKVFFKGKVAPPALEQITSSAYIGINLVEDTGLNQYYSLANKFFDYIHHSLPQVSMDFPEYRKINEQFEVAVLIKDMNVNNVSGALNELLNNETLYRRLQHNCLLAREEYRWQKEEITLYNFYKKLLG